MRSTKFFCYLGMLFFVLFSELATSAAAERASTDAATAVEEEISALLLQNRCQDAIQLIHTTPPQPRLVLFYGRASLKCKNAKAAALAFWQVLAHAQEFSSAECDEARRAIGSLGFSEEQARANVIEDSAPKTSSAAAGGSIAGGALLLALGVAAGAGGAIVITKDEPCSSSFLCFHGILTGLGALMVVAGLGSVIGGSVLIASGERNLEKRPRSLAVRTAPRFQLFPYVAAASSGLVMSGSW